MRYEFKMLAGLKLAPQISPLSCFRQIEICERDEESRCGNTILKVKFDPLGNPIAVCLGDQLVGGMLEAECIAFARRHVREWNEAVQEAVWTEASAA